MGTPDTDDLRDLEQGMWQTTTRADRSWMDRHLAPHFSEFGRSGRVYSRDEIVDLPIGHIDVQLPLTDLTMRMIDVNVALVTYRSDVAGATANRASLWRWTGDRWLMEFHQGTPT